jgi:K+-transporting ATPase ATPase C chain
MNFKENIAVSLKLLLVSIILASVIYPLLVGGIGQLLWSDKAEGSLITYKGEVVGSELIGQDFQSEQFFKARPSSINYDSSRSSGANYAPNNPLLKKRVTKQLADINEKYQIDNTAVPSDLITESGSALDPHISPESAYLQLEYISEQTGISSEKLMDLVDKNTEKRLIGIFGQKRVNVLKLNVDVKEVLEDD